MMVRVKFYVKTKGTWIDADDDSPDITFISLRSPNGYTFNVLFEQRWRSLARTQSCCKIERIGCSDGDHQDGDQPQTLQFPSEA